MRCQSKPLAQIMIHLSLFNQKLMHGCLSGAASAPAPAPRVELIVAPRRARLQGSVANSKKNGMKAQFQ